MTVAFFSGKRRRAAAALGAVSAGLLTLSACDKPTPLATMTVGSSSVSSEATCKGDGKAIPTDEIEECLADIESAKTLGYERGATLRLGVEPEVVEDGKKWVVTLDGNPITEASDQTYRSFPNADVFSTGGTGAPAKTKTIGIIQFNEKDQPLSIWTFKLDLD
ncbi:DUF2771 domain-containing protein [Streptomyces sp. HNM0663]|uniref:DUF2771 domain-containing protein n=1 Tax=Streptomyces chengmaiensis TaxID=3040919 RepID=A0ABT6HP19_9ACTN|nr:DUF2771 domain-containing protein [Streptomyces chengmaiensis]MDH2389644.1 DUF2771 domain-containing protein [Streptomyces chengmaiensis]